MMALFYLYAAEAAMALDVDCLEAVGLLRVAIAVDTSKGGFDVVLDADVVADANLYAAKAAVERDDGAVLDVGIAQVEADEAKAGVYLGAFEILSAETVLLLAEAHVNLIVVAAVLGNGFASVGGACVAGFLLMAEKQQRKAPNHGHKAYHIFPDVGPEYDVACGQEQQDTDTETDDGTSLMLVVEDVYKARHDDEDGPPAFKAYVD